MSNICHLFGNLGQDPELRMTTGGQAVLSMRLATTDRFNKDGQWQERTDWHTVVVWGKRGESLADKLSKGSSIYVTGRISYRSYTDRDNIKRSATEIVATDVRITAGRAPREERQREEQQNSYDQDNSNGPPDDDDIPF